MGLLVPCLVPPVSDAVEPLQEHILARLLQFLRQGFGLGRQSVLLRGDYQDIMGEVFRVRLEHRCARIGRVYSRRQIGRAESAHKEPEQRGNGRQSAVQSLLIGRVDRHVSRRVEGGDGADGPVGNLGPPLQVRSCCQGEVPAGAESAENDALRIVQFGVLKDMQHDLLGVLEPTGEGILWRQCVTRVQYRVPRLIGNASAEGLIRAVAIKHKGASVPIEERRAWAATGGPRAVLALSVSTTYSAIDPPRSTNHAMRRNNTLNDYSQVLILMSRLPSRDGIVNESSGLGVAGFSGSEYRRYEIIALRRKYSRYE